jgi:hypothetical protein
MQKTGGSDLAGLERGARTFQAERTVGKMFEEVEANQADDFHEMLTMT